jgi:hypothetical protein
MAIKIEEVCSANEAFRELEALALRSSGDMAFRGHGDASWDFNQRCVDTLMRDLLMRSTQWTKCSIGFTAVWLPWENCRANGCPDACYWNTRDTMAFLLP